jgi:predicted permease
VIHALKRVLRRLLSRLRRRRLDSELGEELQSHYLMKRRAGEVTGLSEREASQEARREMGNMTLARERSRDAWSFRFLEDFMHDFRYAIRILRKNPGFSIIAILSLALGIGGNTAIFGFVNALLIRPLAYPDPAALMRITEFFPKAGYDLFRDKCHSMEIALVSPGAEFNLTGQGQAVRIAGSDVSANFFSVLGVQVERGRTFRDGEDRPGRDALAILSHTLWQTQFAGDLNIIGRTITLAGVNRTVVGVMPASFAFPSRRVQFWIPARIDPTAREQYWAGEFVPLIARLRPGANIALARLEVHSVVEGIWKLFPWPMPRNWNSDATVISLQSDLVGDVRARLLILLSAVAAVLLIACANIASLLLSRALSRRKEMALRSAIGAGSSRIMRQLLTEALALGLAGSIAGVLLGAVASSMFNSILPSDLPGTETIGVDFPLVGFAVALGVVTGLAFGVVPALSARRVNLADTLKAGTQRSSGRRWSHLRSVLVTIEVALAVVLVVGAGLLMKSLYALSTVELGFSPQRVLTVKISPEQSLCAEPRNCIASYGRLLERARGVSGTVAVALANTVPLDGELPAMAADVEDHPKTADFPSPMLWTGAITPGYLPLMGIPLIAGREFADGDGREAPRVVLVTASTARHFWPHENAIGKHIKPVWEKQWRTIVGVVADVRQHNLANRSPGTISGAIYMPYAQSVTYQGDNGPSAVMNLLVKTAAKAPWAASEIRRMAIEANPNVPVGEVVPLENIASESIAGFRSTTQVFLLFAAAALALAAIGIYGLISYSVTQRTYEIGVRMAIGATGGSIVGLIVRQSLRVMLFGLLAGLAASFVLTRFLSGFLFDLGPTDPMTFLEVAALLILVDVAASAGPAWRASRVDPIRTLRAE